jgi:23S rRNA (pseudouridine1915-N3)-methyltransferase
MHIRFLWIGRTKNASIRSLTSDYMERICHITSCEIVEARDLSKRKKLSAAALIAAEGEELARHVPAHGRLVALDETGIQFSSREFASWFESEQNRGSRAATFLIGGPDGLSPMISSRAHLKLSLGRMTWTHEMCRALLLEQVYRALCILNGIPYHKEGA